VGDPVSWEPETDVWVASSSPQQAAAVVLVPNRQVHFGNSSLRNFVKNAVLTTTAMEDDLSPAARHRDMMHFFTQGLGPVLLQRHVTADSLHYCIALAGPVLIDLIDSHCAHLRPNATKPWVYTDVLAERDDLNILLFSHCLYEPHCLLSYLREHYTSHLPLTVEVNQRNQLVVSFRLAMEQNRRRSVRIFCVASRPIDHRIRGLDFDVAMSFRLDYHFQSLWSRYVQELEKLHSEMDLCVSFEEIIKINSVPAGT
jgi:hypothetical protein